MTLADALDAALEWPVAPSFTRLGPAVRRRMEGWPAVEELDGRGRTVVLTGPTSGLGRAAARLLARQGAGLVLWGRDAGRLDDVAAEVSAEPAAGPVETVAADLADLDAVADAAAGLVGRHPRIDVVVHNAGALLAERTLAPGGHEVTVTSQVLAPFLLTWRLAPALAAAEGGRVLFMSSGGMYSAPLDTDGLEMSPEDYRGSEQYARAKRAQVVLAEMWAERLAPDGTVVHSLHPGWADTPGVASSLPTFRRVVGPLLRTPEEGVDTLVWLALAPGDPVASTGGFWLDRRRRPTHRLSSTRRSDTPAERRRLWEWCESVVGPDRLG